MIPADPMGNFEAVNTPAKTIKVDLADRSYSVIIGTGVLGQFQEIFSGTGKERAFWVTDRNVADKWRSKIETLCGGSLGHLVILPSGEEQKTLTTIEDLCRKFVSLGVERGDALVVCGGGVVGDIVGFAAATYLRGVSYVQIPTTLLAMVDSSVGGKTGVDLPEGKNLIGAFHQPLFVLIDVDFLRTLSDRDFRSGFAEAVKTALIGDEALFSLLQTDAERCFEKDSEYLANVISACVNFKAGVVARDEKESDLRRILNFGHTIGHALEATGYYKKLMHGEALYWGMSAALDLSVETGRLERQLADELYGLLEPHLTVVPTLDFEPVKMFNLIARDKKVKGGIPHFVLLEGVGKPIISDQVGKEQLTRALDSLKDRMQQCNTQRKRKQ